MEFHSTAGEVKAGDGVSGVPYLWSARDVIFFFVITSPFSKVKQQRSCTGIRHGLYLPVLFLFFLQAIVEFHSSTAEAEAGDGVSGVPYGRLEMLIFVLVISSPFSKVKPQRSYTGIRHGLYPPVLFLLFFRGDCGVPFVDRRSRGRG